MLISVGASLKSQHGCIRCETQPLTPGIDPALNSKVLFGYFSKISSFFFQYFKLIMRIRGVYTLAVEKPTYQIFASYWCLEPFKKSMVGGGGWEWL